MADRCLRMRGEDADGVRSAGLALEEARALQRETNGPLAEEICSVRAEGSADDHVIGLLLHRDVRSPCRGLMAPAKPALSAWRYGTSSSSRNATNEPETITRP